MMAKQAHTHEESVKNVPVIDGKALFTINQVAEFMQVQPDWIKERIKNGQIKITKFGNQQNSLVRITTDDLFDFITRFNKELKQKA
jgi:hypothetical protein